MGLDPKLAQATKESVLGSPQDKIAEQRLQQEAEFRKAGLSQTEKELAMREADRLFKESTAKRDEEFRNKSFEHGVETDKQKLDIEKGKVEAAKEKSAFDREIAKQRADAYTSSVNRRGSGSSTSKNPNMDRYKSIASDIDKAVVNEDYETAKKLYTNAKKVFGRDEDFMRLFGNYYDSLLGDSAPIDAKSDDSIDLTSTFNSIFRGN